MNRKTKLSRDKIALEAMKALISIDFAYSMKMSLAMVDELPIIIARKAWAIADAMIETSDDDA